MITIIQQKPFIIFGSEFSNGEKIILNAAHSSIAGWIYRCFWQADFPERNTACLVQDFIFGDHSVLRLKAV